MIEVLKQSAEDVSKVYDILAFGHTERALEILAKTRTSLRQAIAELESQEPDKYEMDIECTKCGAKQSGVLTVNTHPPQRKPLTDGDFLDWYDSAIWGNEDFEQCCQIAFEAGWQFAYGIKGEA
jgi:hypothetical protein